MVHKHQLPGDSRNRRFAPLDAAGATRFGQIGRRITQIRIRPSTAEPIPTARRMLSGVAMALFIARRIQVGLAANISPSITNRMAKPMRKSANAKDLIGLEPPPRDCFLGFSVGRSNRVASSLSTQ